MIIRTKDIGLYKTGEGKGREGRGGNGGKEGNGREGDFLQVTVIFLNHRNL